MNNPLSRKILKQIEQLARKPGFIYVLALLIRRDMFFGKDEAADVNWRERMHNHEVDVLAGFLVKDKIDLSKKPTPKDAENTIREIRKLFDELHSSVSAKLFKAFSSDLGDLQSLSDEEKEVLHNEIFGAGQAMVEPMFYGNSGAYDFQYLWLVEDLYALDKEWLEANGINLELYSTYCFALKALLVIKSSKKSKGAELDDAYDGLTFNAGEFFDFMQRRLKDDPDVSLESVKGFLERFSTTPPANSKFEIPGDNNTIEPFPIISLGDGSYFLPTEFNLAESIYNIPWIWMMRDKQYKTRAEENRGDNIELLTTKLLKRTFSDNAYNSVQIMKGSKVITDADSLALIGNKAIVFQCKSKWLTDLSRKGDDATIANDFHEAIQKAYDQGLASRRVLLNQSGYEFVLKDGTKIMPSEAIDEVYIVCVTASVYPAAINQVDSYLEKRKNDPATIAISLLDLDLMTHYLGDPYEFLFYVKQRIDLYETYKGTSEISFLGFHLRQRIHKLPPNHFFVADETFGQLVDADLLHRVGLTDKPKEKDQLIPESSNKFFERLLNELKAIEQPQVTDVIMFLMSLSENTIDNFTRYMQDFIAKVASGEKVTEDFSASIENEMGFTFVVAKDDNRLREIMDVLSSKNKYKFKANQWLALGCNASQTSRIVTAVKFDKDPWKYSPALEKVVKLLKRGTTNQIQPSRRQKRKPKRKKRPNKSKKRK